MNRVALALVLASLLAGCASLPGQQTESPAGTLHAQVQNDGDAPVDVRVSVIAADGTAISNETDRLPANVGRTFDVPVEEPGRYEVTVQVADGTASGVWRTSECTDLEVRVVVGENRSVDSAWTCADG